MIHIIEGKIGSGKTYYIMAWILERYYYWNKKFHEWFPKVGNPKIFSNISGIKLPEVYDLDKEVLKAGGLKQFFGYDEQTYELHNKDLQNSIIIIDEAQGPKWFPRKYYDATVMFFFQYHRHWGIEIFLATQDVKTLCPELRELGEYYMHAVQQSLHLGPYLRYKKKIDDNTVGGSVMKKDKNVFGAYKSLTDGSDRKIVSNVFFKWAIVLSLLACLLGGSIYSFKTWFIGGRLGAAHNAQLSREGKSPAVQPSKSTSGTTTTVKSPFSDKATVPPVPKQDIFPSGSPPKPGDPSVALNPNNWPVPPIPNASKEMTVTADCIATSSMEVRVEGGFSKQRTTYNCDDRILVIDPSGQSYYRKKNGSSSPPEKGA